MCTALLPNAKSPQKIGHRLQTSSGNAQDIVRHAISQNWRKGRNRMDVKAVIGAVIAVVAAVAVISNCNHEEILCGVCGEDRER